MFLLNSVEQVVAYFHLPCPLFVCFFHQLSSPQIILCSYMCVEAFMIASRNGYPVLPCAPFDAKNPPAANLLWLFYVSKVCRKQCCAVLAEDCGRPPNTTFVEGVLTNNFASLFALPIA